MKKLFTILALMLTALCSYAAVTPLTTKSITETTLIYTSPENLTKTGFSQDGKGTQNYSSVSGRGTAVNPENESEKSYDIGSTGTCLKGSGSNKEVLMYVTNVSQVDAYAKNNGSDGRSVTITATPTSGTPLKVEGTETKKGYSGRVSLELDPSESYVISFTSPNGDITLYAVRLIAPPSDAPSIAANGVTLLATESGVATTADVSIVGSNLTGSTLTAQLSDPVEGLSVSLASNTITEGAIETTATVSYVATENVEESTATLILSDGTTTKEVTITYSALVVPYEQESISAATTWDFSKVSGSVQYASGNRGERLYANITELTYPSTFNAMALTFEGEFPCRSSSYAQNGTLRFNTTVAGTVEVTFSNTGGNNNDRYVSVNGTRGSIEAVGTAQNTEQFEVEAGSVVITGVADTEDGNPALRYYKVVFTPGEVAPVEPVDIVMSFPEAAYTATLGGEFTAPQLSIQTTDGNPVRIEGVVYSSSTEDVAVVDAATGAVTLVGAGYASITATFEGDNNYNAATASYRLIVEEAPVVETLTAVSPYYIFNFSDFGEKDYTQADAEYIVNNLGILVTTSTDIKINGNNKTVDGVKYTKRLQLGKPGSTTEQNVHAKVTGPCQVTVIATSANSKEVRDLAINIAGEETVAGVPGSEVVKVTARYTGQEEADVYVYSQNSGINLYAIIVEEITAETVDVTFNAYGMGTFYYHGKAFTLPDGVTAATYALNADNTKVAPNAIFSAGQSIPAGQAVVIKGEPSTTYTFTELIQGADQLAYDQSNLLRGQETKGTIAEETTAAYYYYTLGAKEGVLGFYWGAANGGVFELGAHKAYLALPADVAANASIVMFDGTVNGISAIQSTEANNTGALYNLGGQRVNAQYKGMVIINGKKQIRK